MKSKRKSSRRGYSSNVDNTQRTMVGDEEDQEIRPSNKKRSSSSLSSSMGLSNLVVDIDQLPPISAPDNQVYEQRLISNVLIVIAFCVGVGLTHGITKKAFGHTNTHLWLFLVLIYIIALSGLYCIYRLRRKNSNGSDPGIVRRSPQNCFPIPMEVEPYIRTHMNNVKAGVYAEFGGPAMPAFKKDDNDRNRNNHRRNDNGDDDDDDDNNEEGPMIIMAKNQSGASYCTECLVWRRCSKECYHCPICQHCVDSDARHEQFLGCCVGGDGLTGGNNLYFFGLISTLATLTLTSSIAVFAGIVTLLWNNVIEDHL